MTNRMIWTDVERAVVAKEAYHVYTTTGNSFTESLRIAQRLLPVDRQKVPSAFTSGGLRQQMRELGETLCRADKVVATRASAPKVTSPKVKRKEKVAETAAVAPQVVQQMPSTVQVNMSFPVENFFTELANRMAAMETQAKVLEARLDQQLAVVQAVSTEVSNAMSQLDKLTSMAKKTLEIGDTTSAQILANMEKYMAIQAEVRSNLSEIHELVEMVTDPANMPAAVQPAPEVDLSIPQDVIPAAEAASEKHKKASTSHPRVLIVGLKPGQETIIDQEYGHKLRLCFADSGSGTKINKLSKEVDYAFSMKFASHSNTNIVNAMNSKIMLTGMSALRKELDAVLATETQGN